MNVFLLIAALGLLALGFALGLVLGVIVGTGSEREAQLKRDIERLVKLRNQVPGLDIIESIGIPETIRRN